METENAKEGNVQIIMSDMIIDPIDPMRTDMDRDELYQLADNIKQNGLINPITVRPVAWCEQHACTLFLGNIDHHGCTKSKRYEVVAGHRRFTACKIAGKIRIECVVRDLTDSEVFSVKAAENLERAEVDVCDEATFILQYMQTSNKTPDEVAKALNRSNGYVRSRLAIAEMPEYMKSALKNGTLKLGVALKLNEITDLQLKEVWTGMAIRDGISIAQADYWLHGWRLNQLPGGTNSENPPTDYQEGVPQTIKFKCDLSGIEDDVRLFRTKLIHESQLDIFNEIARAIQADNKTADTAKSTEQETSERSEPTEGA